MCRLIVCAASGALFASAYVVWKAERSEQHRVAAPAALTSTATLRCLPIVPACDWPLGRFRSLPGPIARVLRRHKCVFAASSGYVSRSQNPAETQNAQAAAVFASQMPGDMSVENKRVSFAEEPDVRKKEVVVERRKKPSPRTEARRRLLFTGHRAKSSLVPRSLYDRLRVAERCVELNAALQLSLSDEEKQELKTLKYEKKPLDSAWCSMLRWKMTRVRFCNAAGHTGSRLLMRCTDRESHASQARRSRRVSRRIAGAL